MLLDGHERDRANHGVENASRLVVIDALTIRRLIALAYYERHGDIALSTVYARLDKLETVGQRFCEGCGHELPVTMRADARTHGATCRKRKLRHGPVPSPPVAEELAEHDVESEPETVNLWCAKCGWQGGRRSVEEARAAFLAHACHG